MFDIDSLVDDVQHLLNFDAAGNQIDLFTIDTLINNYVIPAYNRDCPNIRTVVVTQGTQRLYPYRDLSDSTNFLNHIFLIVQDRAMFVWLRGEFGQGEADNLVSIASSEVVKRIVRMSYKSNNFVTSPMILFDDTLNDYYYSLDSNLSYVLIYNTMNTVQSGANAIINPFEYETLKYFAAQKVSDYIIAGMDMSSIGIVNQQLDKIGEGIRNTDVTKLFNPNVSNLSFGGEISIGFSPAGNVATVVQQAIPMIRNTYRDVQESLRKLGKQCFGRYRNLAMKRMMQLYMAA